MTHFLVVTTNRTGVLARISSIVSSTGANIETASVYPVGDADLSVVHLRVDSGPEQAGRIQRKLTRLVDVMEVRVEDQQIPLSLNHSARDDFRNALRA